MRIEEHQTLSRRPPQPRVCCDLQSGRCSRLCNSLKNQTAQPCRAGHAQGRLWTCMCCKNWHLQRVGPHRPPDAQRKPQPNPSSFDASRRACVGVRAARPPHRRARRCVQEVVLLHRALPGFGGPLGVGMEPPRSPRRAACQLCLVHQRDDEHAPGPQLADEARLAQAALLQHDASRRRLLRTRRDRSQDSCRIT